jgi:hypothetical protein
MAKAAATAARQTSRKAGVRSTAKKADSTRHGFGTQPPARKVAGAFGEEGRGSRRQPGTTTSRKGAAAALGSMKTTTSRRAKAK